MENVILAIHLILALLLIGAVLLQRSEGGGLGMGSAGGVVSGRSAATALGKITWIFAGAFILTSITLTVLAASKSASTSVIDQIGGTVPAPAETAPAAELPLTALPPANAPAAPPPADLPATAPAGTAPAAPAPATTAPSAPAPAPATAPVAPAPAPAP